MGNNSYKGSPYNFIQMKTFDELDLLIISASKSFSGSQEEDQNNFAVFGHYLENYNR
jgi:hypothetical protein